MLVEWKKDRLKIIPITKRCINTIRKNISQINLMPGYNDIEDDIWDEIKKYVGLDKEIELGYIKENRKEIKSIEKEIIKDGKKIKEKVKVEKGINIIDMEPSEAIDVIDNTWNIPCLKKWYKLEGRTDIRNHIDEKIKEIKNSKSDPIGKK